VSFNDDCVNQDQLAELIMSNTVKEVAYRLVFMFVCASLHKSNRSLRTVINIISWNSLMLKSFSVIKDVLGRTIARKQ
jgi:hypothetical protein